MMKWFFILFFSISSIIRLIADNPQIAKEIMINISADGAGCSINALDSGGFKISIPQGMRTNNSSDIVCVAPATGEWRTATCTLKISGGKSVSLTLLGPEVPSTNKERIPLKVEYKFFRVNDKELLTSPVVAWYDKGHVIKSTPDADGEIRIETVFRAYTPAELVEIPPKIFTWLHWNSTAGGQLESSSKGITFRIENAVTDELITSPRDFEKHGWHLTQDNFLQSGDKTGGNRLRIRIIGLPAGEHDVYLRFFGRPRKPGESWWFLTAIGLGNGKGEKSPEDFPVGGRKVQNGPTLGRNPIRIIAGTGGFDPNTVYEVKVGNIGSSVSPENIVSLWIERYRWSQMARIGSVRIETRPGMDQSETLENNPFNREMRQKFISGSSPYGVKAVTAALKVRPIRFDELKGHAIADSVEIAAAKNEWESKQLLIYSPTIELKNVSWNCTYLKNAAGEKLTAEIEIAPVGFIQVNHFDINIHGFWPDPIMTHLKSIATIPKGALQPLWVKVKIPLQAVPGKYSGQITIKPGNASAFVMPINVTVRNFTLPPFSAFRVVMGATTADNDYMINYRMNPGTIYGWPKDREKLLPGWTEKHINAINLGYITDKNPTDKKIAHLVDEIGRHYEAAKKNGLGDKCFFYCFDESPADMDPTIKKVLTAIKKAYPHLPIMTTASREWSGTKTIEQVDWWCPLINFYDYQKAAAARQAGKQVWMYVCNTPEKPYPNVRLWQNKAMEHRIMLGFMAQALQYDGFLYYATRLGWHKQGPLGKNVYTDWKDEACDGLDGQLFQYTGAKIPLPSIRMENLRDGLEDYDYINLARKLAANPRQLPPAAQTLLPEVKRYFEPNNNLVTSQAKFSQSPEALDEARNLIADFIEKAQKTSR